MKTQLEKLNKLTNDLVENNREQLQELIEESDCLFCIARDDGYFIYVNQAWVNHLGHSMEELTSNPWLSFVHNEDVQKTRKAAEDMKIQDVIGFTNRYRTKGGEYHTLKWTALRWNEARITYAIAEDLTNNE